MYVYPTYRVGQNRIYRYIYTVYLVIFKPKIPYVHRIYMVLANPTLLMINKHSKGKLQHEGQRHTRWYRQVKVDFTSTEGRALSYYR